MVRTSQPVVTTILVLAALLTGALIGAGAAVALTGRDPPAALPPVRGEGVLEELPAAPVEVLAETVLLPSGFESTHIHGGPTFNTILEGEVEIREDGTTAVYGVGDFFFEPADFPHRITVRSAARIHVLRLLPPGAPATVEVDPDTVD